MALKHLGRVVESLGYGAAGRGFECRMSKRPLETFSVKIIAYYSWNPASTPLPVGRRNSGNVNNAFYLILIGKLNAHLKQKKVILSTVEKYRIFHC